MRRAETFGKPTPRDFGATPAGPCVSSKALQAGASALGIKFELTPSGVRIGDELFATLTAADEHLEAIAEAMGERLAHEAVFAAAQEQTQDERRMTLKAADVNATFAGALRLPLALL
ncbi:MAG: hypothetical protein ABI605_16755 [Rhizobacter sp.]